LNYATDDFRVDTHPNEGVKIELGNKKKSSLNKAYGKGIYCFPMGKIAESKIAENAVCRSVFLTI